MTVLGRTGVLLDLEALSVVRRARRPVVIVPDGWAPDARRTRVVIALGAVGAVGAVPGPGQRRALAAGLALAGRREAPVLVLADWRAFASEHGTRSMLRTFHRRDELVHEALRPLTAHCPRTRLEVAVPVAEARPGILRQAASADLVVLPRGLDGTTLAECLDRSPVPVVVVP
jgi:hypothetical protein